MEPSELAHIMFLVESRNFRFPMSGTPLMLGDFKCEQFSAPSGEIKTICRDTTAELFGCDDFAIFNHDNLKESRLEMPYERLVACIEQFPLLDEQDDKLTRWRSAIDKWRTMISGHVSETKKSELIALADEIIKLAEDLV